MFHREGRASLAGARQIQGLTPWEEAKSPAMSHDQQYKHGLMPNLQQGTQLQQVRIIVLQLLRCSILEARAHVLRPPHWILWQLPSSQHPTPFLRKMAKLETGRNLLTRVIRRLYTRKDATAVPQHLRTDVA